ARGRLEDPRTQHPYLYAFADPINFRDPTGRVSTGELSIASSMRSTIVSIQSDVGLTLIHGAMSGGSISLGSLLAGPALGVTAVVGGRALSILGRSFGSIGRMRGVLEDFHALGVTRIFQRRGEMTREALEKVWQLKWWNRGNAVEAHLAVTE